VFWFRYIAIRLAWTNFLFNGSDPAAEIFLWIFFFSVYTRYFLRPRDNSFLARHEGHWLTCERYHVLAIDPKYSPGNSQIIRNLNERRHSYHHHYWHHRRRHQLRTPSLPLSPHHNSHRHRRRYRSCFWHRGNTPATYEYLRRLNMHTTDNVLFLLDGRSIYYRATHIRESKNVRRKRVHIRGVQILHRYRFLINSRFLF